MVLAYNNRGSSWPAGRFPGGGHPCAATNLPTPSGGSSRPCSPTAPTTAAPGTPGRTTDPSSTPSSGASTPAPPGPTSPSATAPGRRPTTASTAGERTAPGPGSSTPSCPASTTEGSSTATSGWSMPRSSALPGRPPGRKKNPGPPPELGGPEGLQLREPRDHALGRSQGGFGTKLHLVTDGHGIVLAVWVTPGQRHE